MDGLKKEVFNSYITQTVEQLQKEGRNLKSVALGVDNDEAGKRFVKDIQSKFPKVKYCKPSEKLGKDWNDTLKAFRKMQQGKQKSKRTIRTLPGQELEKRSAYLRREQGLER